MEKKYANFWEQEKIRNPWTIGLLLFLLTQNI